MEFSASPCFSSLDISPEALSSGKIGTVLIVDDEILIRRMLELELETDYQVHTAQNGQEAFEKCELYKIDLVISDINMPGLKGYELLAEIKRRYPGIRTALITAYNIDDYVRMAREIGVSNIIPKSTPFNFGEFGSIVRGLVTEKIFGLPRYMLQDYSGIAEFAVRSSGEIQEVEKSVVEKIAEFTTPHRYVQVLLEELITNALYHAPADEQGNAKYEKHAPVVLEENEVIHITLGKDSEKYGVSVVDTSGRLTSEQVLFRLDRHIHGEGLLDTNGRGLHMSRLYADRLVINIKPGIQTEILFLNYFDKKYHGFKPLYINEI